MPTNEKADLHYLSDNDRRFFEKHFAEMNARLKQIKKNNQLKGAWVISQDLKWLIKQGN